MNRLVQPTSLQGLLFALVLVALLWGCAAAPIPIAVPTPTGVPPTATAVPRTAVPTATLEVPTATSTATDVPPTASSTATEVPPTVLAIPTPTIVEPTATAASSTVSTGDISGTVSAQNANPCLGCHKYNDLLALKPKFELESGSVNPHWYVPHDSKNIPECTNCHVPHAISPLPKGPQDVDMSQVNVQMCFSCHHLQNFTPCKTCH